MSGIRRTLKSSGVTVLREYGLHLIPFQLGLDRVSRWFDTRFQWMRACMINICVLGRKGSP